MKPLLFKSIVLFLLSTITLFAQEKIVFKDSFDVKDISIINLDLKNIPVQILPSLDDTIIIDFSVKYKNFSKKELEKILPKVEIKKSQNKNVLSIKIHSNETISSAYYDYVSDVELKIDGLKLFETKKRDDKFKRKTKQEVLKELARKGLEEESVIDVLLKKIKENKETRSYLPRFVLYIPERLIFKIKADETRIELKHSCANKMILEMNKGSFTAKKLTNSTINITDASLKVQYIGKGNFDLKNASTSLIGSIKSTKLKMDSSFLKIGEIGEIVEINDFNSEIFLYNFTSNFKQFNFTGEYSKIHFYKLKNDYSFKVIGNNTLSKMGDFTVSMQPTKTGKKFTMMERKKKKKGIYAGHIDFDIIHGIIYSHNETFIKSKTP